MISNTFPNHSSSATLVCQTSLFSTISQTAYFKLSQHKPKCLRQTFTCQAAQTNMLWKCCYTLQEVNLQMIYSCPCTWIWDERMCLCLIGHRWNWRRPWRWPQTSITHYRISLTGWPRPNRPSLWSRLPPSSWRPSCSR